MFILLIAQEMEQNTARWENLLGDCFGAFLLHCNMVKESRCVARHVSLAFKAQMRNKGNSVHALNLLLVTSQRSHL